MTKQQFLEQLKDKLSGIPEFEVEKRLFFYGEIIDDKIEDKIPEEQAVAELGDINEIADQIISDCSLVKIVGEKIKPKRRLAWWEIVLIVLGSPIWLSILIALLAIVVVVYILLWVMLIVVYAIEVSFWAAAAYGIYASVISFSNANSVQGFAMIFVALFCAGLAMFGVYGCIGARKGVIILTKKLVFGIKRIFVGKGKHNEKIN